MPSGRRATRHSSTPRARARAASWLTAWELARLVRLSPTPAPHTPHRPPDPNPQPQPQPLPRTSPPPPSLIHPPVESIGGIFLREILALHNNVPKQRRASLIIAPNQQVCSPSAPLLAAPRRTPPHLAAPRLTPPHSTALRHASHPCPAFSLRLMGGSSPDRAHTAGMAHTLHSALASQPPLTSRR